MLPSEIRSLHIADKVTVKQHCSSLKPALFLLYFSLLLFLLSCSSSVSLLYILNHILIAKDRKSSGRVTLCHLHTLLFIFISLPTSNYPEWEQNQWGALWLIILSLFFLISRCRKVSASGTPFTQVSHVIQEGMKTGASHRRSFWEFTLLSGKHTL